MPKLSGHWPGLPSAPGPRPGAHRVASPVQSPSVSCRHQLSMAACASTRSSSTPHLQAAQRRISRVVPVNWPSTRGPTAVLARASSPTKKVEPTWWPVMRFAALLAPLFSGSGFARTHVAHWDPEGSAAPGATVPNRAGAAAPRTAGGDGRPVVGDTVADGNADGASGGVASGGVAGWTWTAMMVRVTASDQPTTAVAAVRLEVTCGATHVDVPPGQPLLIGRDHECQLVVDHPSVSRRHAEIVWMNGGWVMRDL